MWEDAVEMIGSNPVCPDVHRTVQGYSTLWNSLEKLRAWRIQEIGSPDLVEGYLHEMYGEIWKVDLCWETKPERK